MTKQKRSADSKNSPWHLGRQIARWRRYANLSQQQLEIRAGLSHNALSRIENDQVSPRLDTLERLALALQVSIEELQFGDTPESGSHIAEDQALYSLTERLTALDEKKRRVVVESFNRLLDQIEGK